MTLITSTQRAFNTDRKGLAGAGAGGAFGLSRTVIRDCIEGKDLAKMATYITLTYSITLAIAPLIGSYLQHIGGWRWPFYFMLFYSFTLIPIENILPLGVPFISTPAVSISGSKPV